MTTSISKVERIQFGAQLESEVHEPMIRCTVYAVYSQVNRDNPFLNQQFFFGGFPDLVSDTKPRWPK